MKRKLGIVAECIIDNSPVDNLDLIKGEGFESFFSKSTDAKTIFALKNKAEKLGLDFDFIHGPYGQNFPINTFWLDSEDYKFTYNAYKNTIDNARDCGVEGIIMHVSSGWFPPPLSDIGIERFNELAEYAKFNKVLLAFENQRKPDYLKRVFDKVKNNEFVVFCFDCGHANCFTPDFPVMETFGSLIKYTHFHDNFGKVTTTHDDLHLLPFDGNNDFEKIISQLDEFNYTGSIMLEISDKAYDIKGENFVKEAFKRATRLNQLSKK